MTDNAGVLSGSDRAEVTSAINELYADRHIRLWVVYVDNFSGQSAMNWGQSTFRSSELGSYDALLAVATVARSYVFLVPSTVPDVSAGQVEELRRNQIEPALRSGDWGGAAVAAANGLNKSPSSSGRVTLLVALGVIVVAVVILLVVTRYRPAAAR
ncbi:repair family protein [Mycobacterium kansasii 824]|nr:repair family protein [Mycobacterium kansasii 824]